MSSYKTKGCIRDLELVQELPSDLEVITRCDYTEKLSLSFRDLIMAILNECYTVSAKMSRSDVETILFSFRRGNVVDYIIVNVYDYKRPDQSDITCVSRNLVTLLKLRFKSEQAIKTIDEWNESVIKDVEEGNFFYRS